jgi:hypothetical protein
MSLSDWLTMHRRLIAQAITIGLDVAYANDLEPHELRAFIDAWKD